MLQDTQHIHTVDYAGHRCLHLQTQHGTAVLAPHGAQLLSWVPTGQGEVFWLSPLAMPEPAAIRGGVPVCWPWFGKQCMPDGGMQHGPVRNRAWEVTCVHADGPDCVSIELAPTTTASPEDPLNHFASDLRVSLRVDLDEHLTQTLHTHNQGADDYSLTQALHPYFAVANASRVRIEGLDGLRYDDKLLGAGDQLQTGGFVLENACDRVYQQASLSAQHHYTVMDPDGHRQIHITTKGSQSVVLWNPGPVGARAMADVPDDGWTQFFCVEASNAGDDSVTLAPGAHHRMVQRLQVSPMKQ
jgi:glucose-6-phosphate 1-epimerase